MAANGNLTDRAAGIGREDLPAPYRPGHLTHGAYAIERRIRGDEIDGRTRLGRRVRNLRLGFVAALGYPTWTSTPAPIREAVKNAVRLALFVERLFSPFWTGGEVPRAFLTASENLRRAIHDIGLPDVTPGTLDVAAVLAKMERPEEPAPGRAGAKERA